MKLLKSIPFLILTIVIVPSYPMGAFFRAPCTPLVTKIVNRMQWSYGALEVFRNLYTLKKNYDYSDLVLHFSKQYTHDKEYSLYAQKLLSDDGVQVVRKSNTYGSSYHNPFSGNKVIILPYQDVPEGVLFHEYEHIKKSHFFKQAVGRIFAPLALLSVFKGVHYGYRMAKHGYEAAQKIVPSARSAFLKIPTTGAMMYVSNPALAPFFNRYSRHYERMADEAVPHQIREDLIDYLYKDSSLHDFFKGSDTHPAIQERIKALRTGAATRHA